jgi:regulatory protein
MGPPAQNVASATWPAGTGLPRRFRGALRCGTIGAMARDPRKPLPTPTEALLHDAALTHLSRYGATQAGLLRVLDRRIARWAASEAGDPEQAAAARQAARRVVARLAESGAVDDAAFAQARVRSLRRSGKSGRAIGAHLAAKGVSQEMTPDLGGTDDLGAAVIHLRRRRLGPFRTKDPLPETGKRELAALARAGFPHQVASAALCLSRDEAEALITQYRTEVSTL